MGGYGSGIRRARGRRRVHSMTSIDLAWLKKYKFLRPGIQTKLSWNRNGKAAGEIWLMSLHHGIQLEYRIRTGDEGDWEVVDETIPYRYTDTPFNGRRRWFVCPSCDRRCRILYGGRYYRCRKCQHLTYESQYELWWQRPESRANKIIKHLGGHPRDGAFPDKPKGMHWKTYYKLYDKFHNFDCSAIDVMCQRFNWEI